jgi:hypothetical protein
VKRSWWLCAAVLAGCTQPRLAPIPDSGVACNECGGTVPVQTALPAGTQLTDAECASVCEPVWCGQRSYLGCMLHSGFVACSGPAADCGEQCDPFFFGSPERCGDGCANYSPPTCCDAQAPLYCRGLACSACAAPDPRCSLDACRTFLACGGALEADPRPQSCADADGGVDPSVELARYCPDACNAMNAGALLDAGCTDAGVIDGGGACSAQRDSCERACPTTSYRDCMNCSARCGIAFARCDAGS